MADKREGTGAAGRPDGGVFVPMETIRAMLTMLWGLQLFHRKSPEPDPGSATQWVEIHRDWLESVGDLIQEVKFAADGTLSNPAPISSSSGRVEDGH